MDIKLLKQARTKENRMFDFYWRIIKDMRRENKPKSAINQVRSLARQSLSRKVRVETIIYQLEQHKKRSRLRR